MIKYQQEEGHEELSISNFYKQLQSTNEESKSVIKKFKLFKRSCIIHLSYIIIFLACSQSIRLKNLSYDTCNIISLRNEYFADDSQATISKENEGDIEYVVDKLETDEERVIKSKQRKQGR